MTTEIQTQQTLDEKYAQLSAERHELFWFRCTSRLLCIPNAIVTRFFGNRARKVGKDETSRGSNSPNLHISFR